MVPPESGKHARAHSHSENRRVSRSGADSVERRPKVASPPTRPSKGRGAAALGAIVGVLVGAAGIGAVSWSGGCDGKPPSTDRSRDARSAAPALEASAPPQADAPSPPDDSKEPEVAEPEAPEAAVDKPWEGPWLGALAQVTPIYPTARFSSNRLGYLRRGGKAAATDKAIRTAACPQGFYPLVDGGYVCGKYATLDTNDPRVKGGIKAPDATNALPYRYAYNTEHGTPLYSAPPSREAMLEYEPYLLDRAKKAKKPKGEELATETQDADQPRTSGTDARRLQKPASSGDASARAVSADAKRDGATPPASSAAPVASAALSAEASAPVAPSLAATAEPGAGGSGADDELDKPWWQRSKDKPLDVKLSDLDERSGVLTKRMVKGFFIAVDSTFSHNDRLFYKTTDGLLAPSDRMIIPKTPELSGRELSGDEKRIGFVRVPKAYRYVLDEKGKAFRRGDRLERFASFALTGETRLVDKQRYHETSSGFWLREGDSTTTDPGARPSPVAADEKWIDVNLTKMTLMAFVGDKPVYAALISPGKRSSQKARDHRTKTGVFRIREKHIATTMDGDGSTSGDLPYSIMDVPYVQYYDGSYALHAAFWHSNFGREQSHGCVNLAPLDAKWLFYWTEPNIPRGWHGVWGSDKRRGTTVAIHE